MAKFQNIEVDDLVVNNQVTISGLHPSIENHTHEPNEIVGLNSYISEKISNSTDFTVNNALHLDGLNSTQFYHTESPIYSQTQQTESILLEMVHPNNELFIKLNDGIMTQKENNIYFNHKKISYNKEKDILSLDDNDYVNNDIKLLITKDTDEKYLYIKPTRDSLLLINSKEVFQALRNTEIQLTDDFFNLSKGCSFKSYKLFEEKEDQLPLPIILGKQLPLKVKHYQKMVIENLEHFMMPTNNIALVFINKDKTASTMYLDNGGYCYTYNIPENSIKLNSVDCMGCNQVILSDVFKTQLEAIYLFTNDILGINYNKTIGFIPNEESITDLSAYIRTIKLTPSQIEFLNIFTKLYIMQTENIEEYNTVLNTILTNKITTINNVKFHVGDTVTITAKAEGGNADTLNNLNVSNFLLVEDAIETDGKIARFNSKGHLVYPDGHEEWIE